MLPAPFLLAARRSGSCSCGTAVWVQDTGWGGWGKAPMGAGGRGDTHFMPCWKTELRRVLQMMRSAHCTTTMLAKKAVWQVNSTTLRCS